MTTNSEPMADPGRGDTDQDSSAHPHPFHGIVPLSIPPTPLIFFFKQLPVQYFTTPSHFCCYLCVCPEEKPAKIF